MKKNQTTPSILELENTILEGYKGETHSEEREKKEITRIIDKGLDQSVSEDFLKKENSSSKIKEQLEEEKISISVSGRRTKEKSESNQDAIYIYSGNKKMDLEKDIPESISKDSLVLTLSNHVKIAEKKIKELEADNNQLRLDNNKLLLAGETLQSSYDQLLDEHHKVKENYDEDRSSLLDQKKSLEQVKVAQSAEIRNLKMKINTLEKYLNRDVQKIRIRERDLENRLQFKQKELDTIIREKDDNLVNMKRDVDHLRDRLQEAQDRIEKWMHQKSLSKERSDKISRALQISLKILGDEDRSSSKVSSQEDPTLSDKEETSNEEQESSLSLVSSQEDSPSSDKEEASNEEQELSPPEEDSQNLEETPQESSLMEDSDDSDKEEAV